MRLIKADGFNAAISFDFETIISLVSRNVAIGRPIVRHSKHTANPLWQRRISEINFLTHRSSPAGCGRGRLSLKA